MPGGIDVHTHLDMPFGGTHSADDFETGTMAAAFGGTTTLVDFAIQYQGQTLRHAFDTWMAKARESRIDYAFHCIITDLGNAQLGEMGALVNEGIPSFKLFMAYPGVFMLDDASIFRVMSAAAKYGGMICMHAENGGAIDVLVQRALAEGKTAPKYHALTRPTTAEGEATSRAIALAEMAGAPSTSCTSRAMKRWKRSARRATAVWRPMRKLARNICISRSKIWTYRDSKERSTSLPRRCAKNGTRKSCGGASRKTICRRSPRTTALFA